MKKAVMYGAGNIGRGFIGKLFSESGYKVTFIDINEDVINALNINKEYPVGIVKDGKIIDETVKNVCGVLGKSAEIIANEMADADIMATSLGANVLKFVAPNLAAGIKIRIQQKRPLNILLCENLLHADKYLKELIKNELPKNLAAEIDNYIGFVETSIGRMVPALEKTDNILRINVEEYSFLPVDKDAFIGGIPKLKNLYPYSPFSLFVQRKLYMHNMSHALTAYLGFLKGYTYIYEAVGDSEIRFIVYSALVRSAHALSKEHNIPVEMLLDHASNLIYRFTNEGLKDTVARVGGDTKRKLAAGDRLSGSIKLLTEHKISIEYHLVGVAAALLFDLDNNSREVSELAKQEGVRAALKKYADIDDELYKSINELYLELCENKSISKISALAMKNENIVMRV